MVNILIIDDQQNKIDLLESFFHDRFTKISIDFTKYHSSAKRNLKKRGSEYDLILLDMSFENYRNPIGNTDDGDLAGLQILQYMAWNDIHVPVIVCTGHKSFTEGSPEINDFHDMKHIDIVGLNQYVSQWFGNFCLECFYLGGKKSEWHETLERILQDGGFEIT